MFAIGEVRSDSVKRVGAAIGEGSAVVAQLHASLASTTAASESRRASTRGPSETVHPGEGLQQEVDEQGFMRSSAVPPTPRPPGLEECTLSGVGGFLKEAP